MHVAAEKALREDEDVVFVNLHGVAKEHGRNTFERAVEQARDAGSRAVVMEDARIDAMAWSESWRLYRPRWAPWTIIIDRHGKVAFNGDTPSAEALQKRLREALKSKR